MTTGGRAASVDAGDVRGDPHRRALESLNRGHVDFLVGGAFALQVNLGVMLRAVKDLDLFVRPRDICVALDVLQRAGFSTSLAFPHWLGKAVAGDELIDVIFSSGNGVVTVDDGWFAHATRCELLGEQVLICPPEEGIWARAFVMERERFDGADVAHLLRGCADTLDWPRLLRRFDRHWRVLYAHLVVFGFVYPTERTRIPPWVMAELAKRLAEEVAEPAPAERVCQGTLLSRAQFLIDVGRWGYADARARPHGNLTAEQIDLWTRAALEEGDAAVVPPSGSAS